jgi:hypothetical protein
MAMASCGGGGGSSSTGNEGASGGGKFNGTYKFAPPADNYYLEWSYTWKRSNGELKTEKNFAAGIGKGYAPSFSEEGIGYIDFATGKGWMREVTGDKWYEDDYDYSDTQDDSAPGPLGTMEETFMKYFRMFGFEESKLAEYYVGREKVAGVNCWIFDSQGLNGIYMKFWIDPSNGCCLKWVATESGDVTEVTEYNLNYKTWTNNLKPNI